MDTLKKQWIGVLALVGLVLSNLVGGGSIGSADTTTITNPWTFEESRGTTTVTVQSVTASVGGCLAVEQRDGSGYGYFSVKANGDWATSTASCD